MVATHQETQIDRAVDTLKFLSDRNRFRILMVLMRAETCVCDLIDELGIAQPLISYHLAKLRKIGIVQTRREAQWIYYSINPEVWADMTAPLDQAFQLNGVFQALPLPPEAAMGASERCDFMPADPARGAEHAEFPIGLRPAR
ncbi:hypothetical protein BH09CHL1_BH09CHL1_18200 [soil metagenome]